MRISHRSTADTSPRNQRAPAPDGTLFQTLLALAFQQEQERRRAAEERLEQHTKDFAAVLAVLRNIATSDFEVNDVLTLLAERAQAITGADGAAVAVDDGSAIRCVARSGLLAPPLGAQVVRDSGLSGECLRTASVVQCADTETDDRVDPEIFRVFDLRSVVAVPLISAEGVIGLVEIFSARAAAFTTRQSDVAEVLAAVAVQAVRGRKLLDMAADPGRESAQSTPPAALVATAETETVETAPPSRWQFSPFQQWILGLAVVAGLMAAMWVGLRIAKGNHPAGSTLSSAVPADVNTQPKAAESKTQAIGASATMLGVRYSSKPEFTAVEIEFDRQVEARSERLQNPNRIYFDLKNTRIPRSLLTPGDQGVVVEDAVLSRVRMAQKGEVARVVLDLKCACKYSFVLSQGPPYRLVIDVESP